MLTTRTEIETAITTGETAYVSNESEIVLDSPININNSTAIIGGKFVAPDGQPAFNVTSSGVAFDRTAIRGQGISTGRAAGQKFINCTGEINNPLYEIIIDKVRLTDSASDNIWMENVKDSKIESSTIKDFIYSGVMLLSCDNVDVALNTIKDSALTTGVLNNYGIAASDIVNTVEGRSKNIRITSNHVENIDWEGIDTHGGSGIIVTGNAAINCGRGIALVVGNNTRITSPTDCVVTGNLVDGVDSLREGICLYGLSSAAADAIITGNKIKGHKIPIMIDYYNRSLTYIGHNSVPHISWTPITMLNGWKANTSYTPQYMVDGDIVFMRGMVIAPAGVTNLTFGSISSAYAPNSLAFTRYTKGSNGLADTATIGVSSTGTVAMYYSTINDGYSYPIDGQYRMI